MEIDVLKKVISNLISKHRQFISKVRKAELYYLNENDIKRKRRPADKKNDENEKKDEQNAMRNADNRISHNWHQLLLDQKKAYALTYPPTFDVDDKTLNDAIVDVLGDDYERISKQLCLNAGNAGVAWLHVWIDAETRQFKYACVDSKEIIPIYSRSLDKKLLGVLRTYNTIDETNGLVYTVYEYWNDKECTTYRHEKGKSLETLEEYNSIMYTDSINGESSISSTFTHDFGVVPFIPFKNNELETDDLKPIKDLVDVYDKVYSGFVNDTDDVQEVIFVLTNYGGQDKQEFLQDLKQYKLIKMDNDGMGDQSNVTTLAIDIPAEARTLILERTKQQIFISGQGVNPETDKLGNSSGVALKFLYSLLELKVGNMETQFRSGYATLVKLILKYLGAKEDVKIKQTWTRNSINNDTEMAQVVSSLSAITSRENIAKSNPIVENWEDELRLLEEDEQKQTERMYEMQLMQSKEDVIDE